ncbi:glutamate formimidoyltransferase [Clostridiisalibacter paucivorans]|uniref:glutamate formimidoyltransferase n=1 Tax=Clostridiisalibacter paucivorans TaxID=408753 RepID=UPI0004788661|nr:glutamate formimidoyltransferase [Clostridiisalibacter paucivorans]
MASIIQCVPNFSEGRNKDIIEKIVSEIKKVDDVKLLDYSLDSDHNRSVVTFVGTLKGVEEAAFNACKMASELIDMTNHKGEHPRMGATDVIPLIPIKDVTMDDCIELSKRLAKRIGEELNISVFLYEKSAISKDRENLAHIRRGQYEGMEDKIKEEEWKPDFGPVKLNKKSGVTAIGARMPLIAYNVNLNTNDINIANKIAKAVRGSSGGLRYCKAMGVEIKEKDIVQVSMNMVNYEKTPLYRVFDMIEREAKRFGVNVLESEIIGLVPSYALIDCARYYLKIDGFKKDQILENRLGE